MGTLSGDTLWEQIQQDPEFQALPSVMQAMHKKYVVQLPDILTDFLAKNLSIDTYLKVRVHMMEWMLKQGYFADLIDASPADQLGGMKAAQVKKMLKKAVKAGLPQLKALTKNVDGWLQQLGVTEEQMLCGPRSGLRPDVISRYQNGGMTIRDLLEMQPMFFFKSK